MFINKPVDIEGVLFRPKSIDIGGGGVLVKTKPVDIEEYCSDTNLLILGGMYWSESNLLILMGEVYW